MRTVKYYAPHFSDSDVGLLTVVSHRYRSDPQYQRLCGELVIFSTSEILRRRASDGKIRDVEMCKVPDLSSDEIADGLYLIESWQQGLQCGGELLEFLHLLYDVLLAKAAAKLRNS